MALAPVELPHVQLHRALLGYRPSSVNRLLEEVKESFEEVWREREELRDRVEELEVALAQHREVEGLLRETLLQAERTAHEVKGQAQSEAEQIVKDAHTEARSITQEALAERERLAADAARVRAVLESALAIVDEAPPSEASQAA
jgi:cell division septum initiation protein DivIVA